MDEILDDYHDRYLNPEKDDSLIKDHTNTFAHIFGVYIGEVLRRNHAKDYVWQDTEFGIALAKNEKNHVNPIAKAYKQIANGKESGEDIKSFSIKKIALQVVKAVCGRNTSNTHCASASSFSKPLLVSAT